MKVLRLLCVIFCMLPSLVAKGQWVEKNEEVLLGELKDKNMEVRIEALRNLMLPIDRRIPEALLPLLKDEGNSILFAV